MLKKPVSCDKRLACAQYFMWVQHGYICSVRGYKYCNVIVKPPTGNWLLPILCIIIANLFILLQVPDVVRLRTLHFTRTVYFDLICIFNRFSNLEYTHFIVCA